MFGSNLWITNFESGGWRCISWLSQLTPRKSFTFSHRAIWNIFLLLTKWNENTFLVCGKAYCHSRWGKKPCSVTLAQHFYILSSIFSPPPTNFYLRYNHFSIEPFCYLFIWLSLQCSIEQACYLLHSSHKFLIWRSFYLCSDDIKPSGWEQDLHTLQFHSLFMRKVTQWPPHDKCNCIRSSFIFYLLSSFFPFIMNENEKYTATSW